MTLLGSRRKPGLLASFIHVDAAADAIRALRARGIRDLVVYSAAPNHEIEEALDHGVSPVRLFTLIGGLTGCAAGFGMTISISADGEDEGDAVNTLCQLVESGFGEETWNG